MAKLLIIGGTGFFGKSILDAYKRGLLKEFFIEEIIILSRNPELFCSEFSELITDNIKFIKGDIQNIDWLPFADIVIHAATSAKKKDYVNINANQSEIIKLGVDNFIRISKKYLRNSMILYCSSGAIYGGQNPNEKYLYETSKLKDLNTLDATKREYALGKRYAEEAIINLSKQSKIKTSIARCFAFYGKYLPKNEHFAYGNFIAMAEKGGPIEVNATHDVIRSYMHADDLVISLMKIALISSTKCPIYNVGSDLEISIFELAKQIGEKYNVYVSKNENIDFENCDRYVPNVDKIKSLFEKN